MKTLFNSLKSILTLLLFLTGSITLNAQIEKHQGLPPIPSEEQINKMVNHLANEISLSKEQKQNILELYIQHFKTVKEKLCANNRPAREEMKMLRTEFEKNVKTILSDEQQKKYNVFLNEFHAEHLREKIIN